MDKENEEERSLSKRKEATAKSSGTGSNDKKNAIQSKKQKQQHLHMMSSAKSSACNMEEEEKVQLSQGAIDKMLRGVPYSEPFIVGVKSVVQNPEDDYWIPPLDSQKDDSEKVGAKADIFDARHVTTAWFHQTGDTLPFPDAESDSTIIIRVLGYVTSTANCVSDQFDYDKIATAAEPFLYIANYEVISMNQPVSCKLEPWLVPKTISRTAPNAQLKEGLDSLQQESIIPTLPVEAMIGLERTCLSEDHSDEREKFLKDQKLISDFLSYHQSMTGMFTRCSLTDMELDKPAYVYSSMQNGFAERSLLKHIAAMKLDAIKLETFMTAMRNLAGWYQFEPPTSFKKFLVPALTDWNNAFYNDEDKIDIVDSPALREIEPIDKVLGSFSYRQSEDRPCTIEFLEVAMIYLYLMESPPFPDGHDAFAQFAAKNYLMFTSCSGMFLILNWFHGSCPSEEKTEYELARWTTKRNLSLVYRGKPCDQSQAWVKLASTQSGLYSPLVTLLFSRAKASIKEMIDSLEKDQQSYMDFVRTDAIRKAREEAAAEPCLICFDNSPNMLTMCCNKAVHWDCMSKWLKNHESCPQCRGSMPAKLQVQNESDSDEDEDGSLDETRMRFMNAIDSLFSRFQETQAIVRNAQGRESNTGNSEEVTVGGGQELDSDVRSIRVNLAHLDAVASENNESSSTSTVRTARRANPWGSPQGRARRRRNASRRVRQNAGAEGDEGDVAVNENEEGDGA